MNTLQLLWTVLLHDMSYLRPLLNVMLQLLWIVLGSEASQVGLLLDVAKCFRYCFSLNSYFRL